MNLPQAAPSDDVDRIVVVTEISVSKFQDLLNEYQRLGYEITHFSTATVDLYDKEDDFKCQDVEYTAIMQLKER